MTQVVEFPLVSCNDVRMDAGKVGERIRSARQRLGWDRERLAAELTALGGRTITTRTIDNWENGRTYPRDRVGALERLLGVDLRDSRALDIPVPRAGREIVVRLHVQGSLTDEAIQRATTAAQAVVDAVIAMETADNDPEGQ
jgi:transcriptional regulator with XRE-family HTH domain